MIIKYYGFIDEHIYEIDPETFDQYEWQYTSSEGFNFYYAKPIIINNKLYFLQYVYDSEFYKIDDNKNITAICGNSLYLRNSNNKIGKDLELYYYDNCIYFKDIDFVILNLFNDNRLCIGVKSTESHGAIWYLLSNDYLDLNCCNGLKNSLYNFLHNNTAYWYFVKFTNDDYEYDTSLEIYLKYDEDMTFKKCFNYRK